MLRKVWQKWKAFGEFLGNVIARVFLTLFYFTVFMPFAIGARFLSDRLEIKKPPANYWHLRRTQPETIESAKGQS